jgi:hypothetical protein
MMAVFTQILLYKDKFLEAFNTIKKASLVDDMADSRPTTRHTEELINQLSTFFLECCNMYTRKWVTNDVKVMLKLPSKDRIEALQGDETLKKIFSKIIPQPSHKILGIP